LASSAIKCKYSGMNYNYLIVNVINIVYNQVQ